MTHWVRDNRIVRKNQDRSCEVKIMNFLNNFRCLGICFFISLIPGCAGSADMADDESTDIDGQIGETQQAVTQADRDWWKNQTQVSRNWAIMMRGNQDKDRYVGLNCKEWARKVVSDASHGVVSLPSTYPDPNGWQWYSNPYTSKLSSIYAASFGAVVQMKLASGPHTAIVLSNDGTNICWIESNWNLDSTVHSRCQSIQQFLNSVTSGGTQRYSAYIVTGG